MKISVITLGCPKNVVDSEYLMSYFQNSAVQFVEEADEADIAIINTCAFILPAREEAIETILEVVKLKDSGKLKEIYVTGCLPQRYKTELEKEIPEVDQFFDDKDFEKIGKHLAKRLDIESEGLNPSRILQTQAHYAYLKIAEGCDNRCHYCTIPIIKGSYQSKPIEKLVKEASSLVEQGVRELILVAQDTTYYGWDSGDKNGLQRLVKSIAKLENLKWIRLLYAHPLHFSDSIAQLFQEEKKLCKYIDMPIQHISDKILKTMGRKTTGDQIKKIINDLRKMVPEIALRTTLIVGYPGETKKDFNELKRFVADTEFERLGVFKYIKEEGTVSEKMKNHVAEGLKEDRLQELMEIQSEISYQHNEKLLGKNVTVLIDDIGENNSYIGRTEMDAPMIDNLVHIDDEVKPGNFYSVKINRVDEFEVWGNLIH